MWFGSRFGFGSLSGFGFGLWGEILSGIARTGSPPREFPPGPGPHFKAPQSTAASFVRRKFKRHLFVVDSLDKQMQNEKELIRLASAGVGGLFLFVWGVLSLSLCGEY